MPRPRIRSAALIVVGLALAAAGVPTSPEELTEVADLVADVTVTVNSYQVTLADGSMQPCVEAAVDRRIKGTSEATIMVCESSVAEMQPPRARPGQRYRMYLLRSPLRTYEPFSYAGFTPIEQR